MLQRQRHSAGQPTLLANFSCCLLLVLLILLQLMMMGRGTVMDHSADGKNSPSMWIDSFAR